MTQEKDEYQAPTWQPVTVPVEAKVGKVELRLFPYDRVQTAVDDYDDRPWAWGALCRVTFRFGRLVTSKRITQRYAYVDARGWPKEARPSDDELAEGRATVLANLRSVIELHGVKVPDLHVIEEA